MPDNIIPLPVKVYRPEKDLPLPYNQDPEGNAGWDLYATETIKVGRFDVVKVKCNVFLGIPNGYYGRITSRSGLSSKGVIVVPGTIDANYKGQVSAIVLNASKEDVTIERGMRVTQLIIMKHEVPKWQEVDSPEELGDSLRGASGFGASGVY